MNDLEKDSILIVWFIKNNLLQFNIVFKNSTK